MSSGERVYTVAFAGGLLGYGACAKRFAFDLAAWIYLRDLPGYSTTPVEWWLASYYAFLLICGAAFLVLLIRDVCRREYIPLGRRLAWMLAMSFAPVIPLYVLLHGWWGHERDRAPIASLLE